MADPNDYADLGFDPDEDLFGFDEIGAGESYDQADADLEDIFAAFQEEEERIREEATASEPVLVESQLNLEDDPWSFDGPAPAGPAPALPHEAPLPPPANPIQRVAVGFPKSVLLILVAVTSLNVMVAVVTLRRATEMKDGVLEVGQHVSQSYDDLREEAVEAAQELSDLRTPVAPLDPEHHPALELAREEIVRGDFGRARQRIYSLLAIVDRMDVGTREEIEARANYLLAESLHLEAVKQLEARR